MKPTIFFRKFQIEDISYIYEWKNDEQLLKDIVGTFRPISMADAEKWVKGCMEGSDKYIFWAICSQETSQIIGWCAIADIDRENQSASTHSIVIGDKNYRDGFAWIESVLQLFKYTFEDLGLNRLWGKCISTHPMSSKIGPLMFMTREGVLRQALYKDNTYHDILYDAILKSEYEYHKANGDYAMNKIIKRLRNLRHE